jgi:uncharacterized membrane protein
VPADQISTSFSAIGRGHLSGNHSSRNPFRHWLFALNAGLVVFLLGALAAPILAALGATQIADALYAAYHYTCHQWAFRSFFLSNSATAPVAVYDQRQLNSSALDPFTFDGSADLGWKMAFCERDLAIYLGLLAVGLLYARRRQMRPVSFGLFALLILPMAVDGSTQFVGWRESTWQLRVVTGLLFGLASAWLVLPRLDAAFGVGPAHERYAPGASWEARRAAAEPWTKLSRRG